MVSISMEKFILANASVSVVLWDSRKYNKCVRASGGDGE